MDNQTMEQTNTVNAPSLHNLACPKCNASDFKVVGAKGSMGKTLGASAFGAIGFLVADSMSKNDYTYEPLNYKCNSCGKKFESLPLLAQPDEILSAPCKISFKRLSSFVGMAVSQNIWLNGIKVGPVGNGKTVEFETMTKHNILFVTDQMGVAFKGHYSFEAQPGGTVEVQFKRKFKNV